LAVFFLEELNADPGKGKPDANTGGSAIHFAAARAGAVVSPEDAKERLFLNRKIE